MKQSTKVKLAVVAAGLLAIPALVFTGPKASAIGEGQVEQGDIYYSRNLDKGSAFGDPTAADKCDVLQYRVVMHNPGVGTITNVNIHVNLPGSVASKNVSTAQINASNAFPASVSDTATVNISTPQSIAYQNDTTFLLDANRNVIGTALPNTITTTGVNIGSVGVSLNEIRYVQFNAKVNCPDTPVTPAYTCDLLSLQAYVERKVSISAFATTATNGAVFKNAVIDWGDNSADVTTSSVVGQSHTYAADGTYTVSAVAHFTINGTGDYTAGGPACQQSVTFKNGKPPVVPPKVVPPTTPGTTTPTTLVNTGPGSIAALFVIATAAGTLAYRRILSRRLNG